MRYLKTYRIFEAKTSGLTQEQEEFLNRYTKGRWSYDPATGLVDVVGDFDCSSERLKTLSGVKFGKVSGDFDCKDNQLTTLKGAPQKVGKGFSCEYNQLTTLKGAPQKVGEGFSCLGNQLTTLEGAPQKVGRSFVCQSNRLTSLEGAPQEVGGIFSCLGNQLTTLEGAPQEVGGIFSCDVFRLRDGEWNPEGWLEILKNGKSEAQSLILTLISPDALNREIQKDPAGMIMKLESVWNSPDFKDTKSKLVWPQGYEEEMDIIGGLNTIGF